MEVEPDKKGILLETFSVFAISVFAIYLARIPHNDHLTGLVIVATCLVIPYLVLEKRKRNLKEYGLAEIDWKKGVIWGGAASIILLPLFAVLYIFLHKLFPHYIPLVSWENVKMIGWAQSSKKISVQIIQNIFFVGVTEEVLYRCYIQTNLNRIWGKKLSLLGTSFGFGLFETSFLFAVPHILWWGGNPLGLLVFFPSLMFGFLREKTGSFVGPAIFHGFCNVTIFILNGYAFV